MNPLVKFVGADARGLISTETWQATTLGCPRCKNAQANIWALTSEPPIIVMGQEFRIFLCIACRLTALGLNGFKPGFDAASRAQQIIQLGFEESSSNESVSDPNSVPSVLR
jgi:hypothetical protein